MAWLQGGEEVISSIFSQSALGLPALVVLGVALPAVWWFVFKPKLALGFLFVSLVAGQLIRVPLPGQGGGLLVSDVAVVLVLLAAIFAGLFEKSQVTTLGNERPNTVIYFLSPVFFIVWSLLSLVVNSGDLGLASTIVALCYWLRLVSHLLLLPALLYLFNRQGLRNYTGRGILWITWGLAAIGFGQLIWAPDLSVINSLGVSSPLLFLDGRWDPHQWRMVSTWLDPNFLGAFFAIVLPFIVVWQWPRGWGAALVLAALMGTQSRSAWVALGLALVIVSPGLLVCFLTRSSTKKLIMATSATAIMVGCFILFGLVFSSRLLGLLTVGPTVQLRLQSAGQAWRVIQDQPWLGVGYNAYQFAARRYGFISDFGIHSRAGTDNSLLLLWATTGLVGLLLYLAPWVAVGHRLLQLARKRENRMTIAALVGLVVWFWHAQFVNSLTYTHLIITMSLVLAVVLHEPEGGSENKKPKHSTQKSKPAEGEARQGRQNTNHQNTNTTLEIGR